MIEPLFAFVLPQILLGFTLAAVISSISYFLKYLSLSGAVAAVIIGGLIFGGGGLAWSVPLLVFFFSSSILSKLGPSHDRSTLFEKSSTRDAGQVMANGGVGAMLVVGSLFVDNEGLYVAYLGSLAAVTADTWATEIGMRTKRGTVSLTSFLPVQEGTSGGVSFMGTFGGISGALVLSFSALWWLQEMDALSQIILVLVLSGFFGFMTDSVLGATIQAQYRCGQCNRIVEGQLHCGTPTVFQKGFRWLTNDWVNVACSLAGASASWCLGNFIFHRLS